MAWASFVMIISAAYTANLAAFLVLDGKTEETLQGIYDPRVRPRPPTFSPAHSYSCSCSCSGRLIGALRTVQLRGQTDGQFRATTVRGSDVSQYLKRHVELNTMYRNIEPNLSATPEEAIESLRNR